MKRFGIVTIFCLACVLFAVPALAAGTGSGIPGNGIAPYVELKAGADYVQIGNIRNTSEVPDPVAVNKSSVNDWTGVLGGAVGLNFKGMGVPVRTELEYASRSELSYGADPTFINAQYPTYIKSHVGSRTLFLNAYYDITTGTAFTPYVGGGIGEAWNHTRSTATLIATGESTSVGKTTEHFAWNLGLGCTYAVTNNWKVDAGYRYVDLGKVRWGRDNLQLCSREITAQEFLLGVRYQF